MRARPGFKISVLSPSFNRHRLNYCHVPGPVLGAGHVVVMQTDGPCSSGHIPMHACLPGMLPSSVIWASHLTSLSSS